MEKQKTKSNITVNLVWCKGCGICVSFCPHGVLEMKDNHVEVVNPDQCTACGLCELHCPDFAITVEKEK